MKAEGHHNVTFGHSLEKNGCSWCLSVTMRAVGIQCHDALQGQRVSPPRILQRRKRNAVLSVAQQGCS